MEDIEIEYLDEYKDLVLPGIKTSGEGRSAAVASLDQAPPRPSQRRRSSSDSSSSSIDPDIFQKLFDGKFLDDELLNESGSSAKGRFRRSLSPSSSDSNDALDALYNRQSSRKFKSNKRDRLDSYDSLDDLGDVLMGSSHKLSMHKSSSKKSHTSHRASHIVKSRSADSKTNLNKPSTSSFAFNAREDVSKANGSSNHQPISPSKKKAVTILKAHKSDLKPSKLEPKEDPLHLRHFDDDDSDSDSTYEYESDFYDYDCTDDEDSIGGKHIINISTDSSATTSVADSVTPVVSEDEGHQQHQRLDPQSPTDNNERLQSYLNNLGCAETPPSRHKYKYSKKSRSNDKMSSTPPTPPVQEQVNQSANQALEEDKQEVDDEPSSSTSAIQGPLFNNIEKVFGADYVDANLTYKTVERLSQNLAEQIINIDAERTLEFARRSASKPRSNSSSKATAPSANLLSSSHVRKLTYSNESLDSTTTAASDKRLRRTNSDGAFTKRKRNKSLKKRISLAEEKTKFNPLSPAKENASTTDSQEGKAQPSESPKKLLETITEPEAVTHIKKKKKKAGNPTGEKKKRGRPKKHKPEAINNKPINDNNRPIDNEMPRSESVQESQVEDKKSLQTDEMSTMLDSNTLDEHASSTSVPSSLAVDQEHLNRQEDAMVATEDQSINRPAVEDATYFQESPSMPTTETLNEHTMEDSSLSGDTETFTKPADEMSILDSAEQCKVVNSVSECCNESADVSAMDEQQETVAEVMQMADKDQEDENIEITAEQLEEKLRDIGLSEDEKKMKLTEEQDDEQETVEERTEELKTVEGYSEEKETTVEQETLDEQSKEQEVTAENAEEQNTLDENLSGHALEVNAEKPAVEVEENRVELAENSTPKVYKTLRSAMTFPWVHNIADNTVNEQTEEKHSFKMEKILIDPPAESSKSMSETNIESISDQTNKKTPSKKKKKKLSRSPKSSKSLKSKSRIKSAKSAKKKIATPSTVLTESSVDTNNKDNPLDKPTIQIVPSFSEQPTNDSVPKVNFTSDSQALEPSKQKPSHDNITPVVEKPETQTLESAKVKETPRIEMKNLRSNRIKAYEIDIDMRETPIPPKAVEIPKPENISLQVEQSVEAPVESKKLKINRSADTNLVKINEIQSDDVNLGVGSPKSVESVELNAMVQNRLTKSKSRKKIKASRAKDTNLSIETPTSVESMESNDIETPSIERIVEAIPDHTAVGFETLKSEESVQSNVILKKRSKEKKSRKRKRKSIVDILSSKEAEIQMSNLSLNSEDNSIVTPDQSVVAIDEATTLLDSKPVEEIKVKNDENIELLNESLITDDKSEKQVPQKQEIEDNTEKPSETLEEVPEVDSQKELLNTSLTKSIMKTRNLRKELQELKQESSDMEGRTTRSRANTPATRFRSREKEIAENSGRESTRPSRVSKATTFAESTVVNPTDVLENNVPSELVPSADPVNLPETESEKTTVDTEEPSKSPVGENAEESNKSEVLVNAEEPDKSVELEHVEEINKSAVLEHAEENNKSAAEVDIPLVPENAEHANKSVNVKSSSRKKPKRSRFRFSSKRVKKPLNTKLDKEPSLEAEVPASVEPLAPSIGPSTTPINTEIEAQSAPSSCVLGHTVRKLRVMLKRPTQQTSRTGLQQEREKAVEDLGKHESAPAEKEVDSTKGEEEEGVDVKSLENKSEVDPDADKVEVQTAIEASENPELGLEEPDTDQHKLEESEAEEANGTSPQGTTGVNTNDVDMGADDTQEDGKQRKQQKLLMAPPAAPKRGLSSGKSALRRLEKQAELDVQPKQKRRKIGEQRIDDTKVATPVVLKPGRVNTTKHVTVKSPKSVEINQRNVPEPQSTLITTLPQVDNSVIITRTEIGQTTDQFQFKRAEQATSGINISVSVVTNTNSPPKKVSTQAETAKLLAQTFAQTSIKNDDKSSLAPILKSASKSKKAKTEKKALFDAKSDVNQEVEKKSIVKLTAAAAVTTEVSSQESYGTIRTEVYPLAQPEVKKSTKKSLSKGGGKAKEVLKPTIEPMESSKEPVKRAVRAQVTRAGSATRLQNTDTSQHSALPQRQPRRSLAQKMTAAEAQAQAMAQEQKSIPPPTHASKSSSRKRKSHATAETTLAKRAKESAQSVAFPIRITAASVGSLSTQSLESRPITSGKLKETSVNVVPKLRNLRVRINRSVVRRWQESQLKRQQAEAPAETTQAEATVAPAPVIPAPLASVPLASVPLASAPLASVPLASAPLASAPLASASLASAPLASASLAPPQVLPTPIAPASLAPAPVIPAPVAPAKVAPASATKTTSATTAPASTSKSLELKQTPTAKKSVALAVPLPVVEVKAEQEVPDVQQQTESTAIALPEPPTQLEANVATTSLPQVTAPPPKTIPMIPSSAGNSSRSSVPTPSASSSDAHTFGTTRMFSFLYPSRYQRSYANVGLDFCCPNLDEPMLAIDPTRLHSKVQVPVLELPQYMVITTKIITKNDQNIPQKVRAKLEQLAAKDKLHSGMQAVQVSSTASATPALPPVLAPVDTTALPPPAHTSVSHVERVIKPLPQSSIQSAPTTASAVTQPVASSPAVSEMYPELLQLPPVCPTDKMRVELQTRVQLFDAVLQSLARRATAMTVLERQRVIENIVRTSTLMPIDVDVGTKLLENYVCYLNATTDILTMPVPRLRPVITARTSQPVVNKPNSFAVTGTPPQPVISGRPDTRSIADGGSAELELSSNKRPIYDKDRIIGYQYTTKKPMALNTSSLRGNIAVLSSQVTRHGTSTRSATGSQPATQNEMFNADSNKLGVMNAMAAPRVEQSVESANVNPLQNSYPLKSSILDKSSTRPGAFSTPVAAGNDKGSSRNLFIVNQISSSPEECILPDAVNTSPEAAFESEIKGEMDDADVLI